MYVSDSSCNDILKFPPNSNSATSGVLVSIVQIAAGIMINPLNGDLYAVSIEDNAVYLIPQNSTTATVVAGT